MQPGVSAVDQKGLDNFMKIHYPSHNIPTLPHSILDTFLLNRTNFSFKTVKNSN
jgi:hypothetical protein